MSALNVIHERHSIHIVSDGSAWTPDGRLIQPQPKVAVFPHQPAVLAVLGDNRLLPVISYRIAGRRWTYDETAEHLAEAVRESVHDLGEHAPSEVTLCGYSAERGRLEQWFLPIDGRYEAQGMPAWQMVPRIGADWICISPPVSGGYALPDVQFDPYEHGIALLEAQRREHGRAVGMFVQHTELTRMGVSSRIIHRWDDKPGDTITLPGLARIVDSDEDELVDDNGDLILV